MTAEPETGKSYVRDNTYHSRFVAAQAPALLSYVAAQARCVPPDAARPFSYLELGCSSGVTLNGLAAACPHGTFTGVDLNPASIAAARASAARSGLTNVSYVQAAFSGLDPDRLPPADYVACMGTWSWLNATEKDALMAIIARVLRPGGLLCLGYVSLGRVAVTPMWQVLRAIVADTGQGSVARLQSGIALLGELRDRGARFPVQNAQALALLNEVQGEVTAGNAAALHNLAHNLLADSFRAELLDEVAARLAASGLEFAGGAAPWCNDPDLAVPAGLRARYDALPTPVARELFMDFLNATVARTDVFVRQPRRDPEVAERYLHGQTWAALTGHLHDVQRQLPQPGWTTYDLTRPAIRYALGKVAGGAASLAEVAAHAPFAAAEIADAYAKLLATPWVALCIAPPGRCDAPLPARVRPACDYNRVALDAARAGAQIVQLAAPAIGSCLAIGPPASLLLAELCECGPGAPVDQIHGRLLARARGVTGADVAAIGPTADPAAFAALHQGVAGGLLPLLVRLGAMVPD